MAEITIFLLDDHVVVRSGIRMLLESQSDIQIIAEANSAEAGLVSIPQHMPDIVVTDLTLPGMNGIEMVKLLKKAHPSIRFIALSMHEDPEYVQGFLEAGGSGYVPKSAVETQLIDAIKAVARGEYYAPAKLLADLARDMAEPDVYRHAKLTKRELEVIKHITQGRTYKEIARILGISDKTVATYRERSAQKLGLRTRAELVRWALEHNILE